MAGVIDDAFGNQCNCEECEVVKKTLSGLVATYSELKSHLENVFYTRKVKLEFAKDTAYYSVEKNTLYVPHTRKEENADDMVDGFIFESYNAKRKDEFTIAAESKELRDVVSYGTQTAMIECGTVGDFYALSKSFKKDDRTRGMSRCIDKVNEAGGVEAYALNAAHVTDPEKLKEMPMNDTRRLPTKVLYIYEAIEGLSLRGLKEAILRKLNIGFKLEKRGFRTALVLEGNDSPKRQQAEKLFLMLDKNWPPTSRSKERPWALYQIIIKILPKPDFDQLQGAITANAFGYESEMAKMAMANKGSFGLG